MASHITSGTVTGSAVTTVLFNTWFNSIEVVNRGSTDMWARFDGVDPTIAGDDCFYIAPLSFLQVINPKLAPDSSVGHTSNTEIRMISASNCAYTVAVGV